MSPGDLARWAFWVGLRPAVRPRSLPAVRGLSRLATALPAGDPLLEDELVRAFPHLGATARRQVATSSRQLQLQCHLEELVLDQLDAHSVLGLMRFQGREHLDQALASGRGAVLAYPHAGAVMLLIALLSLSGCDYTQLALRGFPPGERQEGVAAFRPSRLNLAVREARDGAEDALPAHFVPMERGVRDLVRALKRGGIVGAAFDGRGGSRFRPARFLGRQALLSTGPWRLAAGQGAAVVPAICLRQADGSHRLVLGPPATPRAELERQDRCEALQQHVLEWVEPHLRANPDHYARWLLHCRRRAHVDDHPLFVDQAEDASWQVHRDTRF